MSMVVWVMMGIAIWHFAVFVPDRFWGGIVGAFLAAIAGAVRLRLPRLRALGPRPERHRDRAAFVAMPGAVLGLAACWFYGSATETEHRPEVL